MRLLLAVCAFALPFAAVAGNGLPSPVQCDEEFADCKETCVMEHGTSTRTAARAKFKKCMGKCSFREHDCREAAADFGSGHPDREAEKQNKTDDSPYRASTTEERGAVQRKAEEEEKAEEARKAEEDRVRAESAKAAEARRAAKSGESTRTASKSEKAERDDPPPRKSAARDDPPPKQAEVRDDPPPKKSDDAPPKKKSPPPEEDKPVEKKKSDKKDRSLEEWDPDAL